MTLNIFPAARSGKEIVMQYLNQREPRVLWRATCMGIGLLVALLAGAPRVVEAELYLRVDHSNTAEYDVLVIDQDFEVISMRDNMRDAELGTFSNASISPTANADELLANPPRVFRRPMQICMHSRV